MSRYDILIGKPPDKNTDPRWSIRSFSYSNSRQELIRRANPGLLTNQDWCTEAIEIPVDAGSGFPIFPDIRISQERHAVDMLLMQLRPYVRLTHRNPDPRVDRTVLRAEITVKKNV